MQRERNWNGWKHSLEQVIKLSVPCQIHRRWLEKALQVSARIKRLQKENSKMVLLRSFGRADTVTEKILDVVGAVSGSSPAFVFMFIEAMADGAVAEGMPRKQAYEFAAQAVYGSAKMVLETGMHPGELKDMVCSPAGTTIEGVGVLEERGMRSAVSESIRACVKKTKQL